MIAVMSSTIIDVAVIGAGQAGLAAAHAAHHAGRQPVLLEAGNSPTGSWPRFYDTLTLFSPARYSALPGMDFPGDPDHYPHRDEVVAYLRRYAEHLGADIRIGHRVTRLTPTGKQGFQLDLNSGNAMHARTVVAASGAFGRPYRPALPGLDQFTGTVLHSADYRNPEPFTGQRVIVVGAGNSAVQIAIELATHTRTTLATRDPIRFMTQRPLGRDAHFWLKATGLDTARFARRLLTGGKGTPVFDTGTYRTAIARGKPDRRSLFSSVNSTAVEWTDGTREQVDVILLATGYRPALDYLADTEALDPTGQPRHRDGLSLTHPGLGFVGLEWQRSFASATLRGVGADARHVLSRLAAPMTADTTAAA